MLQGDTFIALTHAVVALFRDKSFQTRTVVSPDGDAAMVKCCVVAVSDPEHVAYLDRQADFERIDGSARICRH